MTPELFERIEVLFTLAVESEPDEREVLLAACDDLAVRRAVERLLVADRTSADFLDNPAFDTELFDDPDESSPSVPTRICPRCGRKFESIEDQFCSADGMRLIEEGESLVGTVLADRYRVEELVGEGGMGRVYRAVHTYLLKELAIKVLHGPGATSPDALARFLGEGRALAVFHHPHVVGVHDFWVEPDGRAFLVLDFVRGMTLRELLLRGSLEPDRSFEIFGQVAEAVDAAHRAGVVHRDIKPENVVVADHESGPHATVLDFGIAKLRDTRLADGHVTREGSLIGSPAYMAPEQWGVRMRDGKPGIDGRADVFALGLLLYELLTGRRPDVGRGAAVDGFEPLAAVPRGPAAAAVPPPVWTSIGRAIEMDRDDRYLSAGAMLADVQKARLAVDSSGAHIVRASELLGDLVPQPNRRGSSLAPRTSGRPMLLETLRIPSAVGERRIELFYGDLLDAASHANADLLVVSVYPTEYGPTPTSLLGSLDRAGVSVEALAQYKAADLLELFSCWFSKRLSVTKRGFPPAKRIQVFEPPHKSRPSEHVGDIFRALSTVAGGRIDIGTVAMPIVASGDRGASPEAIVRPLLLAATRWMEIGLPVNRLMIVERSKENAQALIDEFESMKPMLLAGVDRVSREEYDVYLSYSPVDERAARFVAEHLVQRRPDVRILHGPGNRPRGAPWPQEAYDAVASSRVVVPILSRSFARSRSCVEDLRTARFQARRLVPLRIDDGFLPPSVAVDAPRRCEGDAGLIVAAEEIATAIGRY